MNIQEAISELITGLGAAIGQVAVVLGLIWLISKLGG